MERDKNQVQRRHKILIVDDEPINIFFLEGILTEEGFDVSTAKNGEDALAKVVENPPDTVLLDIMMPGMSGIEVLDKLMDAPETRYIPVIMVTAKAEAEDVQVALEKGAVEYIRKPVNEMELLARLRTVLRLKDQEDLLKQQLQSKQEFIQMVAHDLRTPFASISGFADLLMNDVNLSNQMNSDHREYLKLIIDTSSFMFDYFNKLLNWASIEAKGLVVKKESVNLRNIVQTARLLHSARFIEKKQQFSVEINENYMILADASLFQQIVNNILSNAIKYTPENGQISILSEKQNEHLKIIFRDSGGGIKGMSPEELFGKTFHKSTRGTKGEKGTGVGLYICKLIADAHGFDLTFSNAPEKGTDFILTVPLI